MKTTTKTLIEKMLLATKCKSERELSRILKISPQAVYNAKKKDKVPHRWIIKIAQETGYNVDWFYENLNNKKTEDANSIIMIPLVEAKLSAGLGSFLTNGEIETQLPFNVDFFVNKGNPKNMVVMRVMGDSMQPEVMDNDYVMIDQSKTEIQPNRIFAVSFEDCIYLKRIDLLPGKVVLKSVNPAYAPVELTIQEDMENLFRVIGKVLWVGREYN